jgi:hypothetical protein
MSTHAPNIADRALPYRHPPSVGVATLARHSTERFNNGVRYSTGRLKVRRQTAVYRP